MGRLQFPEPGHQRAGRDRVPVESSLLYAPDTLISAFRCLWRWGVAVGRGQTHNPDNWGTADRVGVLALTVGQFVPMRPRGTEQGLIGMLHLIEGGVAMLILLVAMGFAAASLGRLFRLYTIATIILMLVFGAWSGMEVPRVEAGLATPWLGIKERIFWYAYELWFICLALTLLRQRAGDREPR